ncbi:hypothetical protein MTBPR1_100052 [Candidatus Terasakiella magnetica]|uniref:Uncharacterized protein n=1 Tax=Candidatus Terasakiella magnetica TaxID=1867952 RepID=A0A1C3RDV6_9PROT|nr:hypothetical protein MTBPR1_100052 [Candidatus Terasakiella magnetica]
MKTLEFNNRDHDIDYSAIIARMKHAFGTETINSTDLYSNEDQTITMRFSSNADFWKLMIICDSEREYDVVCNELDYAGLYKRTDLF